jgi:hypothetical protein
VMHVSARRGVFVEEAKGVAASQGSAPQPATRPRTKCVLPAPRSPTSATAPPGPSRAARARPASTVSSGVVV